LPGLKNLELLYAKIGSRQQLWDDLLDASLRDAFLQGNADEWPRSSTEFTRWLDQYQSQWVPRATEKLQLAEKALQAQVPLAAELKGKMNLALALTYQDAKRQLGRLFYPGFIWDAGSWLEHYPRYLQAIAIRLEKAPRDPLKDQRNAEEVEAWWQRWEARYQQLLPKGEITRELLDFRWLLEEYRVSLYAQQLGTSQVVSAKCLQSHWKQMVSD
jgi:ATP-dependent helicase HrpA